MDFQFDDGRAKDVAGVVEGHADALGDLDGAAVADRAALLERRGGVLDRIQRRDRRAAEARAPAAFPFRILFLDVRRIHQHQFEQVAGRLGGIDRAPVTLAGQARQ
ncbi:hypothetical protein D9M71_442940 [compost metagenome]